MKKNGIYCNCNYVELNDDQIVDINGEGFWIDVALCFVKWKVGLTITIIDAVTEYFFGVSVTDWIESHLVKSIVDNLGGQANVVAYQPKPVDSGYPPNSYQAILWAQQQRKLRYEKAK